MNRKNNIFYKLTQENENSCTELLCNILRIKYIRDIFLKNIGFCKNLLDKINIDHITTQYRNEQIGIPDIKIENEDCLIIIESKIKVNTVIQENQVTFYPKYINNANKQHRGLIFLVPKDYQHINKIVSVKKEYSFAKIIYWEDILEMFYISEIDEGSPVISESLNYLSEMIIHRTMDTKLSNYEVAMLYNPKEVFDSLNLVNKVIALIERNDNEIIEKLGNEFSSSDTIKKNDTIYKGKYIKHKKESYNIFYGLNLNIIESGDPLLDKYVYSVGINKSLIKNIDNLKFECSEYCEYNNWIYIKLSKDSILNEDQDVKFVNNVVEIINKALK